MDRRFQMRYGIFLLCSVAHRHSPSTRPRDMSFFSLTPRPEPTSYRSIQGMPTGIFTRSRSRNLRSEIKERANQEVIMKMLVILSTSLKYLSLLVTLMLFSGAALAQTSSCTYQGKLTDASVAANGAYDFTFRLYDALTGGSQVGSDITADDVAVTDGIFTVNLDFGAAAFTNGAPRFLEISVRPGVSTGAYTMLSPRQAITSAPHSIKSLSADNAATAGNASQLGGVSASGYVQANDSRLSDDRNPTVGSPNYIQNQNAG